MDVSEPIEAVRPPAGKRGLIGIIERGMLASRWLILPAVLPLLVLPLLIAVRIWADVWKLAISDMAAARVDIVLTTLHCIDLVLVAGLALMVALTAYEESVSRLDTTRERPSWLGKIDSAGLKVKVVLSIVAIATIELLATAFSTDRVSDRTLAWDLGIYAMFLVGTLGMVAALRLTGQHHERH